MASRRCPDWLGFTLGVVLDLVELGDQLGSLCQVVAPDRMGMKRWWNAREPGQRTWVGGRERWEAPVEDGGHVFCGSEVRVRWRLSAGGGAGAVQFRRRRRVGTLGGLARRVRW